MGLNGGYQQYYASYSTSEARTQNTMFSSALALAYLLASRSANYVEVELGVLVAQLVHSTILNGLHTVKRQRAVAEASAASAAAAAEAASQANSTASTNSTSTPVDPNASSGNGTTSEVVVPKKAHKFYVPWW